ncbi:ralA-binding protein 1-like [Anthonomus grandis grandis]|uniref:ralA-binding protein 1-like n=1 Tax=Anthonomus grandis grandis TaxID=2921223 RepID=UPI00216618C0|nr:ralA-binding protein 1-like [Anthonomus grandis grandis]
MDSDGMEFPGLYGMEKRKCDSEYEDEAKKEMMSKKKDKKDKEKGYAALEGESSDEASSSKGKKLKPFKFKSKDKSKDSKAEAIKVSKKKQKTGTKSGPVVEDIAEALPIFGVALSVACQRAKCHDEINIPLPVRQCINHLEEAGLAFENIYKVPGSKNRVQVLKKLYNSRVSVKLNQHDIPTVSSLLKAFFRELPEPLLTNEFQTRFEEAAAILNYNTRLKHFNSLINSLPQENRDVLTWLVIHLSNIAKNEHVNKMSSNNLAQTLSNSLRMSPKLLHAFIMHRDDFAWGSMQLVKYYPPLEAGEPYPDDLNELKKELAKIDSALTLMHWEMQQGCTSQARQDKMWESQRIQTDLKRKIKKKGTEEEQQTFEMEAKNTCDVQTGINTDKDSGPCEVTEEIQALDSSITIAHIESGPSNSDNMDEETGNNLPINSVKTILPVETPVNPEPVILCSSRNSHEAIFIGEEQLVDNIKRLSITPETMTVSDTTDSEEGLYNGEDQLSDNIVVISVDGSSDSEEETAFSRRSDSFPETSRRQSWTSEDRGVTSFLETKSHIMTLQAKKMLLADLMRNLNVNIAKEQAEVEQYMNTLQGFSPPKLRGKRLPRCFGDLRDLLYRENHVLEIKKVELIRNIMEAREELINLEAELIVKSEQCYH